MKKHLLFSIYGALIIFIWQFLSFAVTGIHGAATRYTQHQDEILAKFQELGLEEGMYILGQPNPNAAEGTDSMDAYMNKPWATLNYQKDMSPEMLMPMARGILVGFAIAFLLFWVMSQQTSSTLKNRLLLSLAIGMIGFFFTPYTNFIWYKNPDIWGHLLDAIVPWLLLGWIGHLMLKNKI